MRLSVPICLLVIMCVQGFVLCDPDPDPAAAKGGKERKRKKGGKKSKKDKESKGDSSQISKCLTERKAIEISRRQKSEVVLPTCNPDGSYNEIQCHTSTGYCWCVTRDGRHVPGTSLKGRKPSCKGKRRRRKGNRKSRRRRTCSSKDRQTFNSALIKVFKEEYDRANVTPPPSGPNADEFGTEKAIVEWKFIELDSNKDGILRFKEIRSFGRMVKKLIKPKSCARRFLDFCDKKRDRSVDKAEWTLCLGVDIKPNSPTPGKSPLGSVRGGLLVGTNYLPSAPDLPSLMARPSPSASSNNNEVPERNDQPQSCAEEREAAMLFHSQEPDAKHFIPICTAQGTWEKAQCHLSTGYCWCVQEKTGVPIPGTATYRITPNCTFDNEREIKGCPFEQKRRFLVDLIADLTKEMKQAMEKAGNQTKEELGANLSLRETVARWKLKSLDRNNNGMLEKKEWRPLRKKTLKNKIYPRRCRRGFLRYCDADNSKKISYEEWKDCLGLNHNYFNSLPLNPKRKGKNPFVDQLT